MFTEGLGHFISPPPLQYVLRSQEFCCYGVVLGGGGVAHLGTDSTPCFQLTSLSAWSARGSALPSRSSHCGVRAVSGGGPSSQVGDAGGGTDHC